MAEDEGRPGDLIAGNSARDLLALALGGGDEATMIRASDSADGGAGDTARFTPGALVAKRFRITGLAGRGGMGEVYRADDIELGQPIALKFLPATRELDPSMIEVFRHEVRLGRRIAHPNVCRIYDLLDIEGRPAIVMELVDGEDLRSLLGRVGRLPYRKALEIARDVCAGVQAAHERGVAHGDLKPANVMVDHEGRARITDFGLARVTGQGDSSDRITGTVAYMAPEQASRGSISEKGDVYSLGLVLYEIFTGVRARDAHTLAEAAAMDGETPPPSHLQPRLDAQLEAAILLCLRTDPRERPSARTVLSAFPARDPLEAMIASGRTPSPEIVAATELVETVPRRQVIVLSVFIAVALLSLLVISEQLTLYGRAILPLEPRQLAERARRMAATVSTAAPPADEAYWLEPNGGELREVAHQRSGTPLANEPLPPIVFHYRSTPSTWVSTRQDGRIGADAPPLRQRGEVHVALAPEGRLLQLRAVVPDEPSDSAAIAPEQVLALAGMSTHAVRSETSWVPDAPFDDRAVWTEGGVSARVAMFRGRVTRFALFRGGRRPQEEGPVRSGIPHVVYFALLAATTAAGAFLARRNFRARRVDTRAASRVAFWVFVTRLLHVALTGHHPLSLAAEAQFLAQILGSSLLLAAEVWLGYAALEPYVRRRWPRVMVTWTRLVHGRWNDPFIGRALVFGVATGLVVRLVDHVRNVLPVILPLQVVPSELGVESISSIWRTVGGVLLFQSHAIFYALFGVFLLVLLKMTVRHEAVAAVAWIIAMTATWSRWGDARIDVPIVALQMALLLMALYRAGLLAFTVAVYVELLTVYTPLTSDPSTIYFAQSVVAVAVIALLSLGGLLLATQRALPFRSA